MAKMKQFTIDQIRDKEVVTVGHNRIITVKDDVFCGSLHGNEIIQIQLNQDDPLAAKVCVDNCGFLTVTTIRAMNDFLNYFGIRAKVSMSKGKMIVKHTAVNCVDYTIPDAQKNETFYCARTK